jgi:hypothetical protein
MMGRPEDHEEALYAIDNIDIKGPDKVISACLSTDGQPNRFPEYNLVKLVSILQTVVKFG